MTIQECYQEMGGDYQDVIGRLGSEAFVEKFARRFLDDKSFQMIKEGIETQDPELAFRGAHTLKGVCMNLGFAALYEVSRDLTEILRGRELAGYEEALEKVQEQYDRTIGAIRKLG